MRRTALDCGAMSAFRGGADIAARGDSTRSVANDPSETSLAEFALMHHDAAQLRV